jgi:hypothetical protein
MTSRLAGTLAPTCFSAGCHQKIPLIAFLIEDRNVATLMRNANPNPGLISAETNPLEDSASSIITQ